MKAIAYLFLTYIVISFLFEIAVIGIVVVDWLWSFNGFKFVGLLLSVGVFALALLQPVLILYTIPAPVEYLLSLTTSRDFAIYSAWVISILMGVTRLYEVYSDYSINNGASKFTTILLALSIIQTSIAYPIFVSNKQKENSL